MIRLRCVCVCVCVCVEVKLHALPTSEVDGGSGELHVSAALLTRKDPPYPLYKRPSSPKTDLEVQPATSHYSSYLLTELPRLIDNTPTACIMRVFVNCTLQQILLGRSSQAR